MCLLYFPHVPLVPPAPVFSFPLACAGITGCLHPNITEHVFVGKHDVTFGSSVKFTCEQGYKLVGNSSATCLRSGNWSSSAPSCIKTGCPALSTTGAHMTTNSNTTTTGSKVVFKCDSGYVMQGESVLVCTKDGQWNGSKPTCVASGSLQKHSESKSDFLETGLCWQ